MKLKVKNKKRTLLPHQRQAMRYAKPLARIALFMEMRLGKSLTCLRWIKENDLKRNLIVAPKSVLPPWKDELLQEGYKPDQIATLTGASQERVALAERGLKWNLINYEGLLSAPEILAMKWDSVILDESARIRNPQAQITRLIKTKTVHVGCKAILSGYPCPESELDYFEQFCFLHGNFMGEHNYWHWRNKYCIQVGYDWVLRPSYVSVLKKYVKENAFILTRKEAGMGSKKIYSRRYVDMNLDQKVAYNQIKVDFSYNYRNKTKETKWIPVKLGWLTQIASGFLPNQINLFGGKCREIVELLETDLRNEKVIIWFKHNHELNFIFEVLLARKYRVGKFTAEEKIGIDAKGSLLPEIQVMCAQPKCGMMGLDWSAASTAIYYSNWWDGEIRAQSEDRIIHHKKKEPVLYIDLLTKDTIDEEVLELLRNKKLNAKAFLLELSERITK